MRFRKAVGLIIMFCTFVTSYSPVSGDDTGWTTVGTGIEYQRFELPGPNKAYVARMDRSNPQAFIDSALATGELSNQRETVRGMVQRVDGAINYWGGSWGGRNQVVVAINGDYLDKITGQPEKGQVQTGWYAKRFNDYQGQSGFAWTMDRDAFIGLCIANNPRKQFISLSNGETLNIIDGLNIPRDDDDLIIYTPQINAFTPTDDSGVEVLVDLQSPLLITPGPHTLTGKVVTIQDKQGGSTIPFNGIVLSASGKAREAVLANLHEGDEIGITQEITTYEADCKTRLDRDWTSTYASVGGNVTFLWDNEIRLDDERGSVILNPRTAVAYNDQYIFFIVVDGRQPGVSIGMTNEQLGIFARDTLGARWGISQDGGGSSTMIINGEVVNTPSDLCNRLYISTVEQPVLQTSTIQMVKEVNHAVPTIETGLCERPVGNALMMIVQQPAEKSSTYSPGWTVYTEESTEVRLGPGDNYQTTALVPEQAAGIVLAQSSGLDGIKAKDAYWWKVTFGDVTGWVRESSLAAQVVLTEPKQPDCENPSRALRDRVCPEK